jgi:AcrR family transcriptional regulator
VGTGRRTQRKPPKRQDGRRAEARGTARERLLDAAEAVFAESGYRGALVEDIATRAGLTKGALYWHFPSKQDLFFALIEERVDRRVLGFLALVERFGGDAEPTPEISAGLARMVDEERGLFLLMREFWSLAVREPELRERYVERQFALTEAIARVVTARQEAIGAPLTVEANGLATALIALANGLAEERIANPDAVPDALLGDILGLIYDGLAARAATAT